MTIVGRFAFGGWVLLIGMILVISVVAGVVQGYPSFLSNIPRTVFCAIFYGPCGVIGGAFIGTAALVLDRLMRRMASSVTPTPKLPK